MIGTTTFSGADTKRYAPISIGSISKKWPMSLAISSAIQPTPTTAPSAAPLRPTRRR